jgi:Phytanoyl-CoA dioxygenase (PhyH)
VTGVDELVCSNALLGDAAAMRQRLAGEGYLFFRGLLPVAGIGAAAVAVFNQLRQGGWADNQGAAAGRPRALTVKDALGDPAFRAALTSPAFNQIPYLGQLRRVVRMILGPRAFSYPSKVLRAVYPEHPQARRDVARGRYIHQDYAVGGVQDMLTTWVPLIDIPVQLGGLAVLPGSQLGPPLRPRVLSQNQAGWATTSYRAGDALVFHSLTSHAALPNHATSLRLSGDFRWQRPDQPVPAQLVLGPAGGPHEMFSRLFAREAWWEPVPAGLVLAPRETMVAVPPGPSRFFPVHPGWKAWQPPGGGTVH